MLSIDHPALSGSDGKQPWLTPERVVAETYIAYHTNPEKGRAYEQLFNPYNVFPHRVIRAGVTDAVMAFVAAGHGITVLPQWTAKPYIEAGKVSSARITKAGIFVDWHAIVRKSEAAAAPVLAFVKALKQAELAKL